MRKYFSDRNLVIVLFALVLITFSFAHEDSKKVQQYSTKQVLSSGSISPESSKRIVQTEPGIPVGKTPEGISR